MIWFDRKGKKFKYFILDFDHLWSFIDFNGLDLFLRTEKKKGDKYERKINSF